MVRISIGFAALFGLAAEAFMIPSTMSLPEVDNEQLAAIFKWHAPFEAVPEVANQDVPESEATVIKDDHGFYLPSVDELFQTDRWSRVHLVECPGCNLWPEELAESTFEESVMLTLNFEIDGFGKTLLLNEEALYPLGELAPTFAAPEYDDSGVTAAMMRLYGFPEHNLDYKIAISEGATDPETGDRLVTVWFDVVGIDGRENHAKPVMISLVKSQLDELHLLDVKPVERMPTPIPQPKADCSGPAVFCNLFNLFDSKLAAWRSSFGSHRPCNAAKLQALEDFKMPPLHGGVNKYLQPPMQHGEELWQAQESGHFHHHHHHPHHHHSHHHRVRAVLEGIHNFLIGFMIPVLIGIVAGMLASVVGMVLGSFVAWLWNRFVRADEDSSHVTALAISEEKSALLEGDIEEPAPPVYVEKE